MRGALGLKGALGPFIHMVLSLSIALSSIEVLWADDGERPLRMTARAPSFRF